MPEPLVQAAPLRVGLVGGESTGKTALAFAVVAALGGRVVEEALRDFVIEHGRAPMAEEQSMILRAQIMQEAHACALATERAEPIVICDPAPLMTAVYSHVYFDDDSLDGSAIAHTESTFDLLAWCQPDLPWIADGEQRDGPQWRMAAHERLSTLLTSITVPVVSVHGTGERRCAGLLSALRGSGVG